MVPNRQLILFYFRLEKMSFRGRGGGGGRGGRGGGFRGGGGRGGRGGKYTYKIISVEGVVKRKDNTVEREIEL